MVEAFPDRRERFFGRDADVRLLLDRACRPGLTTVVARPLMGKSWTLTEVARQWQDGGDLVGYHESKGAENSHLLHAVANMYARWLSGAEMREQAISLWTRHKAGMVPRVGQMLGVLFEKIGGSVVPDSISGLVRQAFDGLADVQKDILTGGLHVESLPYDQALSLTKLVTEISGRRVLLVLDAWEKAPSGRAEFSTLEAFLRHLEDWPHTHFLLAVRHPGLATTSTNEALQRTRDLRKLSPDAREYELSEMNLAETERMRLLRWVRQRVTAAREVADDQLMEMINFYPGVLYFWCNEANRLAMTKEHDLRMVAKDAQMGRYAELDRLLQTLPEARCVIAARLAFLPRLDVAKWEALRDLVLGISTVAEIEALIDAAVLSDKREPTYGHDTRQAAARKWLVENRTPMMRRVSERLVEDIVERIPDSYAGALVYLESLAGCRAAAEDFEVGADVRLILDAASCALGDEQAIGAEFDQRYPMAMSRNPGLSTLISLALFMRAMAKSERLDREGAIADYTALVKLPGSSATMIAKALTNRGNQKNANRDLEGAITDYGLAIELPDAPAYPVATALCNRGTTRGERGDIDGAVADYTAVIELVGAPVDRVALALLSRAIKKSGRGDFQGEIADYTTLIELAGAPVGRVANALANRGHRRGMSGDNEGAIADYTAVIELRGVSVEQAAKALYNRGIRRGLRGDLEGEIADHRAVVNLPGSPRNLVDAALRRRDLSRLDPNDADSGRPT